MQYKVFLHNVFKPILDDGTEDFPNEMKALRLARAKLGEKRLGYMVAVLRLAVLIAAYWWILTHIDIAATVSQLRKMNPIFVVSALLSMNAAIVLIGLRSHFYLGHAKFGASRGYCIRLSYTQIFFNALFPGNMGGDAVKGGILRNAGMPLGPVFRTLVSERANGLVLLLCLGAVIGLISGAWEQMPLVAAVYGLVLLSSCTAYFLVFNKACREPMEVTFGAAKFSLLSQAAFFATTAFLFFGLTGKIEGTYLVLLVFAAIGALIPVSLGGVGIRELVFFYGARLWDLSPETATSGAALYSGIYLMTALIGGVVYAATRNRP